MNEVSQTQEIDLKDLFVSFFKHWRSLLVVLIIMTILGGGYGYYKAIKNTHKTVEDLLPPEEEEVPEEEEIPEVYINAQRMAVIEGAVDDYNYICDCKKVYEKNKDKMTSSEQIATMKNIANSENYLVAKLDRMNENERNEFYIQIGAVTKAQVEKEKEKAKIEQKKAEKKAKEKEREQLIKDLEKQVAKENEANSSMTVKLKVALKRAILGFLVGGFFYLVIFGLWYIFNGRVKPSDQLGIIFRTDSLGKIIDWDNVRKYKGLDKVFANWQYGKKRRVEKDEAVAILSTELAGIIDKNEINRMAIVGLDMAEEEINLRDVVSKAVTKKANSNVDILAVDCPLSTNAGIELVQSSDAAIVLVKSEVTRYEELKELIAHIKKQKIDIVGLVAYE